MLYRGDPVHRGLSMAAAGNNNVEELKKLIVDELVSSWMKALEYYSQVIETWRARDRAIIKKEEKLGDLRELKEFMDSPECLDQTKFLENFKAIESSVEDATANERFLVTVVETKEEELTRLVTEKRKYILTFPELVPLVARKAARLYAVKAAYGWMTDIERRKEEVYNMEAPDEWNYNEKCDELEYLCEEERKVDDDEYELAAECEGMLLKHANVICNRRLHVLTLITP